MLMYPIRPRKKGQPVLRILCVAVALIFLTGCQTPAAVLDLVRIGQMGLDDARVAQQKLYAKRTQSRQTQLAALDAAFDADVRLVAAGAVKTPDGPVALDADWVISARKGYGAARSLLEQQSRDDLAAHAIELDNLRAAHEALQLANQLVVSQWNAGAQIKQQFMQLLQQSKSPAPSN